MIKKFIRGVFDNGKEVIKTLEDLGGKNTNNLKGIYEGAVYFIKEDGVIDFYINNYAKKIIEECFTEIHTIEDSKHLLKGKFQPNTLQTGTQVLARNYKENEWFLTQFSHHTFINNKKYYVISSGHPMIQCLPYNKKTKHLLGTTNTPPAQYNVY